jgi:hypothetical protein
LRQSPDFSHPASNTRDDQQVEGVNNNVGYQAKGITRPRVFLAGQDAAPLKNCGKVQVFSLFLSANPGSAHSFPYAEVILTVPARVIHQAKDSTGNHSP